jgi:hypothetical protein
MLTTVGLCGLFARFHDLSTERLHSVVNIRSDLNGQLDSVNVLTGAQGVGRVLIALNEALIISYGLKTNLAMYNNKNEYDPTTLNNREI